MPEVWIAIVSLFGPDLCSYSINRDSTGERKNQISGSDSSKYIMTLYMIGNSKPIGMMEFLSNFYITTYHVKQNYLNCQSIQVVLYQMFLEARLYLTINRDKNIFSYCLPSFDPNLKVSSRLRRQHGRRVPLHRHRPICPSAAAR